MDIFVTLWQYIFNINIEWSKLLRFLAFFDSNLFQRIRRENNNGSINVQICFQSYQGLCKDIVTPLKSYISGCIRPKTYKNMFICIYFVISIFLINLKIWVITAYIQMFKNFISRLLLYIIELMYFCLKHTYFNVWWGNL